ncbi:hypothetical protein [Brevibacterium sp.]|uniref:hypothetical protein n=1 Tax=Brevibacterium sp. TaxID=1701 RepID=UPI00281267E8|nr:hypothetical protein [Brevibacterium sp.]
MNTEGNREFGHLIVERSGGIGGFQLVWDLDIDHSEHREEIGPRVAQLPWSSAEESQNAPSAADRYVFAIESRFGQARFGEGELSGEWKEIVDEVREITEPERRRPG